MSRNQITIHYNGCLARRRFFVNQIRGGSAELLGDDARHLTRVLRVEPGQRFEISDNRAAWLAEVTEARGERVIFRVIEPIDGLAAHVHMTLVAAIIKFDHFEWIVEKSTELGVDRIIPVNCARTEKGLFEASHKRSERWRRIARESSQQSRRVTFPEILPAITFEAGVAETANYRYLLEESTAPPFLTVLPEHRTAADHVAVMLGPEGGWTDGERRMASSAGWLPVSLGPLVLRAETAAAGALAIVSAAWLASNATTIKG
jgi:16S rRNA (uracil1498-N3)-methyltransferase